MKLGIKPPEADTACAQPCAAEPQKPSYPNFCLRDRLMDLFVKKFQVDLDSEGTAVIRWKVSGLTKEQWGRHIQFEVLEMSKVRPVRFEERSADEQFDELRREAETDDGMESTQHNSYGGQGAGSSESPYVDSSSQSADSGGEWVDGGGV